MRPNTPKEFNSSGGFKKKKTQSKQSKQLLNIFELNSDIFVSIAKSTLPTIQQNINRLDIDKKIRCADQLFSSQFIKPIKKWLKQNWDKPPLKEEDMDNLLKALGCQNSSDALTKLWKLIKAFDSIVVKQTQLQSIVLIKYQELYNNLIQQTGITQTNKNNPGVNLGTFSLAQSLINRYQDMFEIVGKLRKEEGVIKKQFVMEKDYDKKTMESQLLKLKQENEILKNQNQKLHKEILQSLQKQVELKTNILEDKVPYDLICQTSSSLQLKYKNQIRRLYDQIFEYTNNIMYLQAQNKKLKAALKVQENQNEPIKKKENQLNYQQCLREQMKNMRLGFFDKYQKLKSEMQREVREIKKKYNETRMQFQKVQFQKRLLMNKWEMLKKDK